MATPTDSGSHAAGPPQKKSLTWLWVLLAVLVLALLAWWLLDDDEEAVDASPVVAEETEEIEEPLAEETEEPVDEEPVEPVDEEPVDEEDTEVSPPVATAGAILVGDVDLLAADVDPTTLIGETVVAEEAMVQAVVADEAFLAGPDPERTVLVRLADFVGEGEQESPFNVQAGEMVGFTGTVEQITEELLSSLSMVDEEALQGNIGDVYIQVVEFVPAN